MVYGGPTGVNLCSLWLSHGRNLCFPQAFCETLEESNYRLQKEVLEKQKEIDYLKLRLEEREQAILLLEKHVKWGKSPTHTHCYKFFVTWRRTRRKEWRETCVNTYASTYIFSFSNWGPRAPPSGPGGDAFLQNSCNSTSTTAKNTTF